MSRRRGRLLLRGHGDGDGRVSFVELFFDLVYVFAITQLSHSLLEHLTMLGALETLVLFLAVWWAWIYTTWATNWLDPERGPVRLVIATVMLASLVLSSALPHAFGAGGLTFALAYIAIQIARTGFVGWAMWCDDRRGAGTQLRAIAWFAISGLFWIVGALSQSPIERIGWWAIALLIEYLAPVVRFWIPGIGKVLTSDWHISGGHMAERCGLFIIIALGEGIIVTGTEFGHLEPTGPAIMAFVAAFVGSFALWWVYFDLGAKRGAHHIEHHEDPGLIARNAFTYWHIPIVAGIIVLAVADEQTLVHPHEAADASFIVVLAGGAALFLLGTMVFKRLTSDRPWFPLSHIGGLCLLAALAVWGGIGRPDRLSMTIALTLVFALVAFWEWVSFHGGWIRWIEPRFGPLGRAAGRWSRGVETRRLAERGADKD
ncbi:MAG: low temperature requirement protein A [Novosphingobium sp.]|nr:low temperature requirement protein A [Novosphingobium sp.]